MIDNTNISAAVNVNASQSTQAGSKTNVSGQSQFSSFIDQLAQMIATDLEKDQNASAAAGATGNTQTAGTVTTSISAAADATQAAGSITSAASSASQDLQLLKTLEMMLLSDIKGAQGHHHHHHHHHHVSAPTATDPSTTTAAGGLDLTAPTDPTVAGTTTTDTSNQTTAIA